MLLGCAGGVACGLFAGMSVGFGLPPLPSDWDCWRSVGQDSGHTALQDAVAAGQESGIPLYPCRSTVDSDVRIGRVRADFGGCHVGYAGREVEITPYAVLTASWKAGAVNTPPESLGVGEELAASPEGRLDLVKLYLCRASYQGAVHSGQAKAGERGCSFGYGGKQIVAQTYDILQTAPWLTWTGAVARNLPDNAIASGSEGGESVFACRAASRNGLHPGKIKKSSLGCNIVSDGREVVVERFEVLVSKWSIANAGTAPVSAYPAGWESGGSQFVCRAQYRSTMQIGRVSEALGGCHVGMQSTEVIFKEYEVLTQ